MDEQKYLIVDNRQGFKDLTGDVKSIKSRGNLVDISFHNSEKTFAYARKNIIFSNKPVFIENDIAINGHIELNAEKKVLFGNFLKLFVSKTKKSELHHGDFEILKTRVPDTLAYLHNVAKLVKNLPSADSEAPANTIIADALEKIKDIPVNSPLYTYLSGILPKSAPRIQNFIFPFQCNESQLNAVEQTFSNSLSLIQGPPGTGKTQTILNILINAVVNGQRVAIVSNNNSAIQNVVEKLSAANGLDFLVALLGNKVNQEKFLANQVGYPSWLHENIDCTSQDEQRLYELHRELKTLFKKQNELKIKVSQLHEWNVEAEKFAQCYPDVPQLPCSISSEKLLLLFSKCNMCSIKRKQLSFWFKLWQVLFCRHWNFTFWNQPLETISVILKKLYYQKKSSELQNEIAELEKALANADFENKHKTLNLLSWQLLKVKLRKKYSAKERKKFYKSDLRNEKFLSEYPVLLSTTFMINHFMPEGGFDLLIMDEASQVDLCTGAVSIACAKNVVIVGDDKQLPCVITAEDELKLDELNSSCNIADEYKYHAGQSILSSLQQALPAIPNTTLCEHYRCDPLIIGFCNQKFYDNNLVIHSRWSNNPALKVLFTAPGNHARGHFNLRQCQEIDNLVNDLVQNRNYPEDSIGLCSPFREQAERLGGHTVHKFQGREKDVIIMSTVDNQISDFTADEQLINVAVSRAKKEFHLVVSSSNRQWDNCIGDLVNYIRYYDSDKSAFTQGNITSVFDMLYNEYQQYLNCDQHNHLFFDSPAEEIIYKVLSGVLQENDVDRRYCFRMHIPLREIFRDNPGLSEDEAMYLNNANTHIDFLIYEKFGKTPCFGIEVDGYNFHKSGTRQSKRDQLKNSIFAKNNIPLLRLATNDSNEYEKITNFIFGERKIAGSFYENP